MANSNGWGDGSVNNNIGWGQAPNNNISWGKSQITSYSGATDIDGGNTPVNTVAPAITGTAQEGQTLTCSTGTWSGSPSYTYQWKRNGSNIGSATNSTYTVVTADVGQSIKCTVTATNFIGSASADSNTVTPTSSTDADAQAFITAAAITDPTQQSAINTLVTDLKGYSIWTKFKAIYPVVGGTAASHKWNLKDPRDLDAAFRLTFATGWTHSANGMTPLNTYADSNLSATTGVVLPQDSVHMSFYSRTNSAVNYIMDMSASNSFYFSGYYGSSLPGIINNLNVSNFAGNVSVPNSLGFFLASRTASTTTKTFRNSSLIRTDTRASSAITASTIRIGYYFGGASADYSNRQYAFASIGDGLTDTEAANFYTAVQAYQTALSRNV
jgi:hypothetical protein